MEDTTIMFTPRQMQIIRLLSNGLSRIEVASELNTKVKTVDTHMNNISKKSGCKNTTHLVAELIRKKVID